MRKHYVNKPTALGTMGKDKEVSLNSGKDRQPTRPPKALLVALGKLNGRRVRNGKDTYWMVSIRHGAGRRYSIRSNTRPPTIWYPYKEMLATIRLMGGV